MSDVSNIVSQTELAGLLRGCAWFAALDAPHQDLVLATARAEHVASAPGSRAAMRRRITGWECTAVC